VCTATDQCKSDDLVCYITRSGDAFNPMVSGFCTQDCAADRDCDPIDGIPTRCAQRACEVDCAGDAGGNGACPEGMVCLQQIGLGGGFRCNYGTPATPPEGTGEWALCGALLEPPCGPALGCYKPGDPGGLLLPSGPGYCSPGCASDDECTAPDGVSASPSCSLAERCVLNCTDDASCPAGTTCKTVGGVAKLCSR
jgi:hypothetical protein